MKTISLSISKSSVESALKNISGYTGRATSGGIDRLSATSDESKLTDDLFSRSISALIPVFNSYLPTYTDSSITINVPANFDDTSKEGIEKEVNSFLINNATAEWFFIARNADDTAEYQKRATVNYNNINNLLNRRIKPQSR